MEFSTVANDSQVEIIINRSRFIARTSGVQTEEEAIAFIKGEQERFPDATHHCYAYVLGDRGMCSRHSDDGEPSGTAGMPILDVIKGSDLTNTVIVVTRYFGGVLLGTGGLVRAYSSSAKSAIDQAGIVRYVKCAVYHLDLDYPVYSRMDKIKSDFLILDTKFDDKVRMDIAVRASDEEQTLKRIVDICLGQLVYERLTEAFYPV